MTRPRWWGVRASDAEHAALLRAAAHEGRAYSALVRKIVVDWLRLKGWLK